MPLASLFSELHLLLEQHQSIWRANPFREHNPDWMNAYPNLAQQVVALDEETVELLEQDPAEASKRFSPSLPDLNALIRLCQLSTLKAELPQNVDNRQFSHIPGRKWTQIAAFTASMGQPKGPVLEWCAGKGHLGRLIGQQYQVEVTSLEWDAVLCEEGEKLAYRAALPQRFVCADALDHRAAQEVKQNQHAVALHACGDLHGQLLRHAAEQSTAALTVSPCCYHLTRNALYQPFSISGERHNLALSREELRIAVQETATAPKRVQRLRGKEMSYRLGYQALVEQVAPEQRDEGVPSCKKQRFGEGFASFCHWAAGEKGITLPDNLDWLGLEQEGQKRWHLVRRLSLVRSLFSRPLELYLVLDRACYLEEQGYRVTLARFTDRATTPRNLLIQAERIAL
ncbi:methyltransferase [Ferrimonas balearica]|uniref:methyltransferase n=1 Tax=Ferrimonas balearica TaxID=44012 RepID=UPI001C990770|nr:methyltransferase [Ferrimonas balearica]MBY5920380.1 SAM-dependent methyltransferase [Ferrimonas balearica]MBY5996935.1 SAM-dependent methyltransferase [Ferrimonas balearica]